jgi:benzoyl-CoA reductase/2-hydroxyglutaryl-CoA dehydratase subunit BcrC/BadD/HgdB
MSVYSQISHCVFVPQEPIPAVDRVSAELRAGAKLSLEESGKVLSGNLCPLVKAEQICCSTCYCDRPVEAGDKII